MKPDGVTMETTEATEAAALAESSSLQENIIEEAPFQLTVETEAAPKAKDEPPTAEPKGKSKVGGSKIRSAASGSSSRVETASHRTMNDVKSSAAAPGGRKVTTNASKASAAGAVPKRPASVTAVSSIARNQTKGLDKRPVGPAKTTSLTSTTVTNGTRPKTMNGPSKKTAAEAANGAKPKTTITVNKTATSTALKSSTSTRTGPASAKATRPAVVPSTSRATATKPSTTAPAKSAASRVTTAPPAGRTITAHIPKTAAAAAAKKDVSRPPVTKKPTTDSAPLANKKSEPSKPTMKLTSAPKASTTTKVVDDKVFQFKPQHSAKLNPAKRPVAAPRPPLTKKAPLGQTPPASPASKPLSRSSPATKRGNKPTQTVPPFSLTKKKNAANATECAVETQDTASSVEAAATIAGSPADATMTLQQEIPNAASAVEEVPTRGSDQHTAAEVEPQEKAAPSSSQSPIGTTSSTPVDQELVSSPARPSSPPVADLPQQNIALTDNIPSRSTDIPAVTNSIPQMVPPANVNEEEDEEERDGSQLVSVSEMSGTTQPTEESRPGSGGPAGGSAWRAGGVLLSELDSEEVSGSHQGASELSAPGVLEGTESTDDLGDGSLKGAMDMEGASAGSPDFEKVPDIPVNDFDEDDDDEEDDSDRVCDMDVGSERTDEQQRPRHDNDVDNEEEEEEEEDDDVEMASEGVTESGLESYGNADEDDFAEDERLDNLNRVAQPPPPPPVLPSAPAAQWEQPNPFAEPLQPQLVLDTTQAAAPASPLADPMQADSKTPTQTSALDWQEQQPAPFAPQKQDIPQHSTAISTPQKTEAQQNIESSQAQEKTPAPEMPSSNTMNSNTSMPGDQGDQNPDAAQNFVQSLQPDFDSENLGLHLESGDKELEEEAEPETLPADEILEGPATAPLSNPSSSSVTDDEASDTEGEAQLNEASKSPLVVNTTFDMQPTSQRALSTVEEGEEAEGGAGEEATPPSAASLASYGFDSVTASSSNAQSTESCIKSPGIFSLEELSEEAKDPSFLHQPHTQQCDAEHQYIECGKLEAEAARHVGEETSASDAPSALSNKQGPEEIPGDIQPPYYSAICEKIEDSFAGFTALPHHHRRDHSSYPRIYCDIVKPHIAAVPSAKLSCADLPPRSPGQQARSPQLRRLEQHQRQLLELQQRREQQSRPLEEAEQERKRRAEEEERKKKEEAEEELKRNKEVRKKEENQKKMEEVKEKEQAQVKEKEQAQVRQEEEEELKQRRDLELQLQQQQQELKQRQQIMQWQQELQQTAVQSPSSGLCTIYEALENSEEEDEDEMGDQNVTKDRSKPAENQQVSSETVRSDENKRDASRLSDSLPSDSTQSSNNSTSPERPPPLDLDWGKKVDIVQQLINQTLLLNGDGCSSLLLLPGGAGGTLSPLESSLWPSLLPPLTPPSATVTSVSSFSPEATGSSPQGEWTVVELETHH